MPAAIDYGAVTALPPRSLSRPPSPPAPPVTSAQRYRYGFHARARGGWSRGRYAIDCRIAHGWLLGAAGRFRRESFGHARGAPDRPMSSLNAVDSRPIPHDISSRSAAVAASPAPPDASPPPHESAQLLLMRATAKSIAASHCRDAHFRRWGVFYCRALGRA